MNQSNFFERHMSSLIQSGMWCILSLIPLFLWMSTGMDADILMSWIVPMGVWAVVFYVNYLWLIPRMFNRHKWRPFVWVNVMTILFAAAYLCYDSISFEESEANGPTAPVALVFIAAIVLVAVSLVFFVAVAFALRSVQRNRSLEKERRAQQEEIARMETEQLKAQLNPHFLFNSLNNISALTAIDPELAQNALATLSEMMRHILKEGSRDIVPVRGELELIENYITLMRLRYTDRLRVSVDFPENPEGEIPPMLIITLMENAFKHGAASSMDCFIEVKASAEGGLFRFEVTNSLLPESARTQVSHRVGLKNLKRRLDIQFPGNYRLETGEADGCYKAVLEIPCGE